MSFIEKNRLFEMVSGPFLGALCFGLLVCGVILFKPPQIGMVNVNAIVNHYIRDMAKSNLKDEALKKHTDRFMGQLEKEVKKLAAEKKVTLLLAEAVIAGAEDYTQTLEQRIHKSLEVEAKEKKK